MASTLIMATAKYIHSVSNHTFKNLHYVCNNYIPFWGVVVYTLVSG